MANNPLLSVIGLFSLVHLARKKSTGPSGIPPPPPPPARPQGNLKATSRQHSALIWFALQCSKAKQCTVSCGYDHMPVSRGYMRAEYPLLTPPSPRSPSSPTPPLTSFMPTRRSVTSSMTHQHRGCFWRHSVFSRVRALRTTWTFQPPPPQTPKPAFDHDTVTHPPKKGVPSLSYFKMIATPPPPPLLRKHAESQQNGGNTGSCA